MNIKLNKFSILFKQSDLDYLNAEIRAFEVDLNNFVFYSKPEIEEAFEFTSVRIEKYRLLLEYLKGEKNGLDHWNKHLNTNLDQILFNFELERKIERVQLLLNNLISYSKSPYNSSLKIKILYLEKFILNNFSEDEIKIVYDKFQQAEVLNQIDSLLEVLSLTEKISNLKKSRNNLLKNVKLKRLLIDRRKAFRRIIQNFFKNLDDAHNVSFSFFRKSDVKTKLGNIKYFSNGQKIGDRSPKWHIT